MSNTKVQGIELAPSLPAGAATEATLSTRLTEATGQLILAALGGPTEQLLSRTAFGESAVAQRVPKAGWTFAYGVLPVHVTASVVAGGTTGAVAGQGYVEVTNAGDSAILQTRKSLRYVPGIGGLLEGTFRFPPLDPLLNVEFGVGTDTDGLFVASRGGVMGFLRRANGVEFFNPIASLDPALWGTFNPARLWPIALQYQWLGGGAINYYLETPSSGALTPLHRIAYAGTSTDTSVRNPNLPVRLAMTALPGYAGGAVRAFSPSAMAFQEGDEREVLAEGYSQSNLVVAVGATELPVFSLSNQALFGGVANRVTVALRSISFCVSTNSGSPRSVVWRIWRGTLAQVQAALTGDTFLVAPDASSCCRADIAATAVNTAGLALAGQWRTIVPRDRFTPILPPIELVPGEALVVTARRSAGSGTVDVEPTVRWKEPI